MLMRLHVYVIVDCNRVENENFVVKDKNIHLQLSINIDSSSPGKMP
jgi:hypothetical protein